MPEKEDLAEFHDSRCVAVGYVPYPVDFRGGLVCGASRAGAGAMMSGGEAAQDGELEMGGRPWPGLALQALVYRLAAYAMLNLLDDAAMLALMFC